MDEIILHSGLETTEHCRKLNLGPTPCYKEQLQILEFWGNITPGHSNHTGYKKRKKLLH